MDGKAYQEALDWPSIEDAVGNIGEAGALNGICPK
jgi:hypothetical protein